MDPAKRRVWFITGCSKGFGLCLVKELLKRGTFDVAATTRSIPALQESLKDFDTTHLLPLSVDLTSDESITQAVDQTIAKFGKVDVLVNNAGFGLSGTHEEASRDDFKRLFEINVFSVHAVTRIVLPHMRKVKNGCILNVASIGAQAPRAGNGIYAATKAAVVAMTESLADEVAQFGIKACSVCPGPYRTNFKNAFTLVDTHLECYDGIREQTKSFLASEWPGDPEKGAPVFIELAMLENLPKVFFFGQFAYERAKSKYAEYAKWADDFSELSLKA